MWGNHLLDMYQHANFNISFPHDLTRHPTRLIQWQYWWWFWFSSVFVLYYFLLSKIITKRTLKFKPKIVTSYRSHGRWGDIVVAVIPIFWCLNILSHSTLLLRMSEFQTETNILTIRVRGRQWYWVYKMEIDNFFSLANKKVWLNDGVFFSSATNFYGGKNNLFNRHESYRQYWRQWFQTKYIITNNNVLYKNELLTTDTKLNDMDINKKLKDFNIKTNKIKNTWFKKTLDSHISYTNIVKNNNKKIIYKNLNNFLINSTSFNNNKTINNGTLLADKLNNGISYGNKIYNIKKYNQLISKNINCLNKFYFLDKKVLNKINESIKTESNKYSIDNNFLSSLLEKKNYGFLKEATKYSFDLKPRFGFAITLIELITPACENIKFFGKLPLLMIGIDNEYETKNYETTFKYFMVFDQHRRPYNRFLKSNDFSYTYRHEKMNELNGLSNTPIKHTYDFYAQYKSFFPMDKFDENGNNKTILGLDAKYNLQFVKSNYSVINLSNANIKKKIEDFDFYSPSKYNISQKYSLMQGNLKSKKKILCNQRLLYTTSILVLPTSLNITVITNSYDVIHSWFIPGLGLKMDCVPGRSTHHTLYIDHPGLYYGQCAEICGRFHHHMPIKIAALHWEHFLLWWYHHTMNLASHPLLKDYTKTAQKEFKNSYVYPVTSKFTNTRPIV